MVYSKFLTALQLSLPDTYAPYAAIVAAFHASGNDYSIAYLYKPDGTVDEIYEPAVGMHVLGDEAYDPERKCVLAFAYGIGDDFGGMHFLHPNY